MEEEKKKQERIQLAMAVGIYLAIIIMLVAIIILAKNINEIKTDPIVYGIQKHDYLICSCYDKVGNNFDFNADGYIPKVNGGFNIQIPN